MCWFGVKCKPKSPRNMCFVEIIWCLAILCWAIKEIPKCAETEDTPKWPREVCEFWRK